MRRAWASPKEKEKTMENREGQVELVRYEELPGYLRDNPFILGGYRSGWPLRGSLFSLFRWHNETLNIWTHLIGLALFVGLTVDNVMQQPQFDLLFSHFPRFVSFFVSKMRRDSVLFCSVGFRAGETNASNNSRNLLSVGPRLVDSDHRKEGRSPAAAPRWPLFVYLAGALFCLLSSTLCHLLCCHSHRLGLLLLRIDFVGIAIMIVTSFFPPIYYIFQCQPHWQLAYLAGITGVGCFAVAALLSPARSAPEHRSSRAFIFVAMALCALVPAVHATAAHWSNPRRAPTLALEGAMAAAYGAGAWVYVARVPERWVPGAFDMAGHSHQIFHVLVVAGAVLHYAAVGVLIEWRDAAGCDWLR